MAYCVNCGVELAKSEKKCPLCGVEAVNPKEKGEPTGKPPYPKELKEAPHVNSHSLAVLLTLVFLLPMALTLTSDVSLHRQVTWSGYVAASLVLLYVLLVPPVVLRRGNPVFYLLSDFAAVLLFLLYVEKKSGGSWFLGFGMPLVLFAAAALFAVLFCAGRWKWHPLKTTGVCIMAIGALCLVVEILLNIQFKFHAGLFWSLYPFITLFLIGTALVIISRSKKLKDKLEKRFFI